jgi:hypothetical protein
VAEGEDLGSNLLHVGQSTPANSCVRSSCKGAAKATVNLRRPLVSNLHHPFSVKVSGVTRVTLRYCPRHVRSALNIRLPAEL